MLYPTFLNKKDTIGVTAPSDGISGHDKISLARLQYAKQNLTEKGFSVIETSNVRRSIKGRSGTGSERARELESLFLREDVKAIICAAGGDFLLEMLPEIDFQILKDHPKWVQGYSDPTALLFYMTTALDIATIYGPNIKTFGMQPWHASLSNNLKILTGHLMVQKSFSQYEKKWIPYQIGNEGFHLDTPVYWEILNDNSCFMEGRMIGGCIDVLSEIFGTPYDKTLSFIEKYEQDGIIWYFDNAELSSEGLIRTLWKFKEAGWFQYTKGILFGRSMIEKSYYDISYQEAILESLKALEVPIVIHVDIGHVAPQMTIINGAIATVKCQEGKGSLIFSCKK